MKYFLLFLLATSLTAGAQQAKPYEMLVNGVKVIVVPSGNEIVQVDMMIKGGVQNYAAGQTGIERLALRALTECGTQKRDKNAFKNALDDVDAQMFGAAGRDASRVSLNCIKGDFEAVWPLYVEALTMPKFDETEFARIKQEAVTQLRQQESNPDFALQKMAMETVFKGMDYEKMANGTVDNIQKITAASAKAHLASILTRSRVFFVVVGDVDKADLQKKMTALIAKIPQGKPFVLKRTAYVPRQNSFVSQQRDVATNYIMGISAAPAPDSKEYYSGLLASRLFYQKAFLEVRTNNGLSYAPSAGINMGLTPYSTLYVTTKEPDKYIAVARTMVDQIKKDGFPADDVQNTKNGYTTSFYSTNETNGALASIVGSFELLQGDWKKAFTLTKDLQAVKPAEVNQVFNKYVGNFNWVYQGDPTKVNPTLYTQPETPKPAEKKPAF